MGKKKKKNPKNSKYIIEENFFKMKSNPTKLW